MNAGPMMRDNPHRLILDLQAAQVRAHKLGLHITAQVLNNAMNTCEWEMAGDHVSAGKAAHGEF